MTMSLLEINALEHISLICWGKVSNTHCDHSFSRAIKLKFVQSNPDYWVVVLPMATKVIIITTHHENQSSK